MSKFVASLVTKVRAVIAWAESPKVAQAWRAVRLTAAVIASSGIVDQLAHGTATRAGLIAAATAAFEVGYRALHPTKPKA